MGKTFQPPLGFGEREQCGPASGVVGGVDVDGILDVEGADGDSCEGLTAGSAAEVLAQISGDGPDVSPACTMYFEVEAGPCVVEDSDAVHVDPLGLDVDGQSLASKPVAWDAFDLDGAEGGRHLFDFAAELGEATSRSWGVAGTAFGTGRNGNSVSKDLFVTPSRSDVR